MAILIEKRSFIATVPEPSSDTFTPGSPFEITASSTTATTVVSTANFTSADADDYVGNWLEATNGNVEGEWVRIVEFDPATDTATVDAWSVTPSSLTTLRMWVPPEPLLVHTTAAVNTTTIEAGDRTETATTYWADPDRFYAICEGSAGSAISRGEAKQITAFDGSSTFTTAAFSAAPANGDLFVMRTPLLPAADPEVTTEQQVFERQFMRGDFDTDPILLGPRSGSFSLQLEAKGPDTAANGATTAVPPSESRDLLASILLEDPDGSTTISGTSSTTTAVNVTDGQASRLAVGNIAMVNGECFGITAIDASGNPDVLTASPALSVAPTVAGVDVYGGVNYRPRTASGATWAAGSGGFRSHTIERYIGGSATGAVREILYGWHFDLEIMGLTADSIPMWKFSGPFDAHLRNEVSAPYTPTFDTKLPRPSRASRVVYGGTALNSVREATFKTGYSIEPAASVSRTANGRNGHIVTGRKTTGTLKLWMEDATMLEDFHKKRERDLLIQVGNTPKATIALWIPAMQLTKCVVAKEAGGYSYDVEYKVIRSGTSGIDPFCLTLI